MKVEIMERRDCGEEYVFLPGTHEYVASNGTRVTIHAGDGVTLKQFEPALRMYAHFRDENARKKRASESDAGE